MWVARCGSDFEGFEGDSFEFFSEERNKLPPFFFVGETLIASGTQQIQRIDAYLCPMSAALERSKMDDEK